MVIIDDENLTSVHASYNLDRVYIFFFVIIVTACGCYIIDWFNLYRGNKTTEGSEKESEK